MPVSWQNDGKIDYMLIIHEDLESFVKRNEHLKGITTLAPKGIDHIRGSYAMVDPAGRFFDGAAGKHIYSPLILEVGVKNALNKVSIEIEKVINRDGFYSCEDKNS